MSRSRKPGMRPSAPRAKQRRLQTRTALAIGGTGSRSKTKRTMKTIHDLFLKRFAPSVSQVLRKARPWKPFALAARRRSIHDTSDHGPIAPFASAPGASAFHERPR